MRQRTIRHGMQALGAVLAVGSLGLASLPAEAALQTFYFSVGVLSGAYNAKVESALGIPAASLTADPATTYKASGFAEADISNIASQPNWDTQSLGTAKAVTGSMQVTFGTRTFSATSIRVIFGDCGVINGALCSEIPGEPWGVLGFAASGTYPDDATELTLSAPGQPTLQTVVTVPDVTFFGGSASPLASQFQFYDLADSAFTPAVGSPNTFMISQQLQPTTQPVPVPAALPLFASAILLGGAVVRRRKAAAA